MSARVSSVFTQAVARFEKGGIIAVADDRSRENEADLVIAASFCTAEKMAFIIRHTCGIVCVPTSRAVAARLRLPPMAQENNAPLGTAFTVSVDVCGVSTGISASERALTVQRLANPQASPDDFTRPGHVFPLIAHEDGVLGRAGHTEAAVDLCRFSGHEPVAVICELFNDDGSVMKGAQVQEFIERHGIPLITVADIAEARGAEARDAESRGSR